MKTQIKIAVVALGMMLTANAKAQDIQISSGIETPTFFARFNVFSETSRLRIYIGQKEGNETPLFMRLKDANGNEIENHPLNNLHPLIVPELHEKKCLHYYLYLIKQELKYFIPFKNRIYHQIIANCFKFCIQKCSIPFYFNHS